MLAPAKRSLHPASKNVAWTPYLEIDFTERGSDLHQAEDEKHPTKGEETVQLA